MVQKVPLSGLPGANPLFPPTYIFQRKSRLANEAAEIRKQMSRARDMEREAFAQSALDGASELVLEALLRSAAAGVELLEMREVRLHVGAPL